MPTKKRAAALALMAKTGILESNYNPPLLRLLWRLGFVLPLPHFVGFGQVALVAGGFFGPAWGVLMWATLWRGSFTVAAALAASLAAGVVFGVAMAAYYAYGRRKHRLPLWHELPVA